jgi:hypothetical protein
METALTGSEKQIAWASEIRDRVVQDLNDILASAERYSDVRAARGKSVEHIATAIQAVQEALPQLFAADGARDSAHWWITWRQMDAAWFLGCAAHSDDIIAAVHSIDSRDRC